MIFNNALKGGVMGASIHGETLINRAISSMPTSDTAHADAGDLTKNRMMPNTIKRLPSIWFQAIVSFRTK